MLARGSLSQPRTPWTRLQETKPLLEGQDRGLMAFNPLNPQQEWPSQCKSDPRSPPQRPAPSAQLARAAPPSTSEGHPFCAPGIVGGCPSHLTSTTARSAARPAASQAGPPGRASGALQSRSSWLQGVAGPGCPRCTRVGKASRTLLVLKGRQLTAQVGLPHVQSAPPRGGHSKSLSLTWYLDLGL